MSHINRFSGTEWWFMGFVPEKRLRRDKMETARGTVWRGDRLRVVGVAIGDETSTFSKYVILGIVNSK